MALWQEIFFAFFKLGLTSFGGPVAHLGYFREAFVVRRQWLSEADYADLVALCQFLPGPASSQVGMALGTAGYTAGLAMESRASSIRARLAFIEAEDAACDMPWAT